MKFWNLLNFWKNYCQGSLGCSRAERVCNNYSKWVKKTHRCCTQRQNHDCRKISTCILAKLSQQNFWKTEFFQASRREIRCINAPALKLQSGTIRRVWTSERFVAHSFSEPGPPFWLTFWVHCHSHISLTQNSILISWNCSIFILFSWMEMRVLNDSWRQQLSVIIKDLATL